MKRKGKIFVSLTAAAVFMNTAAMAATTFEGDIDANLWTQAIYTDQVRIYGSGGYLTNYVWPGSTTARNSSYPNCLLDANSRSTNEVFGSECSDLLYTEPENAKDANAYMLDGDRLLENYSMYEWNGFLFVLTGGNKVAVTTTSVSNSTGLATSYQIANRTDTSGRDSYLYVFDISRGENYDKCRYAKWSAADFGFQAESAYQQMESIAVDDNYIYIVTNSGKTGNYSRGIAVFENTVKRGENAVLPSRIDVEDESYSYGAKEFISSSMYYSTSPTSYKSTVADGKLITWAENMTASLIGSGSAKAGAFIRITPVNGAIGDTVTYYASSSYKSESDSAGISLDELLTCDAASSWSQTTSPTIRHINVLGSEITFLVTYQVGSTYYKQVFLTDWSNPGKPMLKASCKFADSGANAAVDSGATPNLAGRVYTYEDYIYISSIYGVDTVKKFDDNNNISLSYNSTLEISSFNSGKYLMNLAVIGDYLYGWYNSDQNNGLEIKAKLSGDRTEVLNALCKSGARRTGDVLVYGGSIYTMFESAQLADATRQSCVFVAKTDKIMPVSLSVDYVEDSVSIPYTIKGTGYNINAVAVNVNGNDAGYVKTTNDSGVCNWEYTVYEPGEYLISFTGATIEGYPSAGTTETVDFTGISKANVGLTASYVVNGTTADVTAKVVNSNTVAVKVIPITCLYSEGSMEAIAIGTATEVASGETAEIGGMSLEIPASAVNYTIKTFLIDGFETITPLTEAYIK